MLYLSVPTHFNLKKSLSVPTTMISMIQPETLRNIMVYIVTQNRNLCTQNIHKQVLIGMVRAGTGSGKAAIKILMTEYQISMQSRIKKNCANLIFLEMKFILVTTSKILY